MEETLLIENKTSKEKVTFMLSLFQCLCSLKENDNVDDVYIYFNMDKIELYIFTYAENFDTEDFITDKLTEWETEQKYFPETYINISDLKMNILPRKSMKVC